MDESVDISVRRSPRSALIGAAITAVGPFFISRATSSYAAVNGKVVSFTYRDWSAVGCGVIALGMVAFALWQFVRSRSKPAMLALLVGVAALGGVQIARGFGVFEAPPVLADDSPRTAADVEVHAPPPAPPPTPATCADANACTDLAASLQNTNPDQALVAGLRACDFGAGHACLLAAHAFRDTDGKKELSLDGKACDLGEGDGCNDLGIAYAHGDGVAADPDKGWGLVSKGCDAGSKLACKNLAFHERDVAHDLDKASTYAARACEEGDDVAKGDAFEIGLACDLAATTTKDPKLAAEYLKGKVVYNRAACEVSAKDCFNYALELETGDGIDADPTQARAAYQRGCDAGDQDACTNLGIMMIRGQGGPRDVDGGKAVRAKACQAGQKVACKAVKP